MVRKSLNQWQILVIEQLLDHAHEFKRYDEASLKTLVEIWRKVDKVNVVLK